MQSAATVPPRAALPRHVAVIMDGNGRWATARHRPRVYGHSRGFDAVRAIVEACGRRGVAYLTLFAFSSENWRRPPDEVSTLMRLFMTALQREVGKLADNGVRLRIAGERDDFDPRRTIRHLVHRPGNRADLDRAGADPFEIARDLTVDFRLHEPSRPLYRRRRRRRGDVRNEQLLRDRLPKRLVDVSDMAPEELVELEIVLG